MEPGGPVAHCRFVARSVDHGLEGDSIMVTKFLTFFALIGGLAVAACNTVEGAGEDIQSAGETVEDAAN